MENFKELPLEVRLSAYLDGQVSEEDARELDALLSADPNARELLELLKTGSEFGNQAFEEMLKEPVPLNLVRAIKDTSAKPAQAPVRQAANGNVVSFLRFVPQAIAASAVLLLAGGYTGYFVGVKNAGMAPMEISETSGYETPGGTREIKTRGFSFDTPAPASLPAIAAASVAGVHDVYSKETARLAELPATDAGALKSWLSSSTGVSFNIPNLSADGLRFEGGRLVAVDGKPAGALFYKNGKGEVVAVYFAKGKAADGQIAEGTSQLLSGAKGDTAWFVAGPTDDAKLKDIAAKASAQL
jgi:anti-sigma factor RsiW